jgi:uncharacterized protein YuzE
MGQAKKPRIDFRFDKEADAAYLSLRPRSDALCLRQINVTIDGMDVDIYIDVDTDGLIHGIEFLGAGACLDPALLLEGKQKFRPS